MPGESSSVSQRVNMKRRRQDRARSCVALVVSAGVAVYGCAEHVHFLGYDMVTDAAATTAPTASAVSGVDAAVSDVDVSKQDASIEAGTEELDAARVTEGTPDAPTPTETSDAGSVLVVLKNPPNVLVDVLGLEPNRVSQRINAVFEQLFFGDPSTESIFVDAPTGAYIFDVLHEDTRMDAMGYGMLVLTHFDRQAEFDKLWATVDTKFRYASGPRAGYFRHSCETDFSECSNNIDTFGVFYVVTSLFIAQSRWGGSYSKAATEMLVAMRGKEQNGVVDGVLNVFSDQGLPRRRPYEGEATDIWTGSLMPAFFDLWYVNTGDIFWHRAAEASRAVLQSVVHPKTGLPPLLVDDQGKPTQETPEFREGAYGVGFQMALDHTWIAPQPGYTTSANLLVDFFRAQGPGYPSLWNIDGEALNDISSGALVALNGAAASISKRDAREAMMRAVWDMNVPTGVFRYYDGTSQLLSLMFLGGQLRPQ